MSRVRTLTQILSKPLSTTKEKIKIWILVPAFAIGRLEITIKMAKKKSIFNKLSQHHRKKEKFLSSIVWEGGLIRASWYLTYGHEYGLTGPF